MAKRLIAHRAAVVLGFQHAGDVVGPEPIRCPEFVNGRLIPVQSYPSAHVQGVACPAVGLTAERALNTVREGIERKVVSLAPGTALSLNRGFHALTILRVKSPPLCR